MDCRIEYKIKFNETKQQDKCSQFVKMERRESIVSDVSC